MIVELATLDELAELHMSARAMNAVGRICFRGHWYDVRDIELEIDRRVKYGKVLSPKPDTRS